MLYVNSRSIKNKIPDLQALITEHDPHLISISETWLDSSIKDCTLGLLGYKLFRRDRNSNGGGVLLGVKNLLLPTFSSTHASCEVIAINITVNNRVLKIITAYRPPNCSVSQNLDLINYLDQQVANSIDFVILGDFNYGGIDWAQFTRGTSQEEVFLQFLNENNAFQHINLPTHIGGNILDLLVTSDSLFPGKMQVLDPFSSSDHCVITAEFLVTGTLPTQEVPIKDFKNTNWELVHHYLAAIDWQHLLTSDDNVSHMWIRIKNVLNFVLDSFVPTKTKKSRKSAPWFNNNLKRLSRKKRRLYHRLKRFPSDRNRALYTHSVRMLKRQTECSKSSYEKKLFSNKNTSPNTFYSYVNSKFEDKVGVQSLIVDGVTHHSDNEKAALFSNQYNSVYTEDDGSNPVINQLLPMNSFSSIALTAQDVFEAINALNGTFSTGVDNLPAWFIKRIRCHLVLPLLTIFRKSLSTGEIPLDWKYSIIIPVLKEGKNPNAPESYRPISLTSAVCKILEKIVHKYMMHYLSQNSILSPNQHGFLKNKSTLSNLLLTMNDLTKAIDERNNIDIIYIDLAKAFDSVSHPKLLHKLEKLGFGGDVLSWLRAFITNRPQSVKVNGAFSSVFYARSGVAQGSILGPSLFLLYINDLSDSISFSNFQLYADDTKLYSRVNDIEDCNRVANDLDNLFEYFDLWQLKINVEKCETVHLGNSNVFYPYTIDDRLIRCVNSCRDLGVTVSHDLSPREYCKNIVKTTFYKIKLFRLGFSCNEISFAIDMYKTYIRPSLEYNTQIWSPHLISDIDLVERVQRKFTKYLPGYWRLSYVQRLNALNLQSLEERRLIFDLVLMFKIIHGAVDIDASLLFSFNQNVTRGHDKRVCIQYSRLNCRKFFFVNRVAERWNSLDQSIVDAKDHFEFKDKITNLDHTPFLRGSAFRD